jgi:hypothetical protein
MNKYKTKVEEVTVELAPVVEMVEETQVEETQTVVSQALTVKRFVIRKALVGKKAIITFTNAKGQKCTYDHDAVYEALKDKFEAMECFIKYKSYTNSNNLPTFVRNLPGVIMEATEVKVEEVTEVEA